MDPAENFKLFGEKAEHSKRHCTEEDVVYLLGQAYASSGIPIQEANPCLPKYNNRVVDYRKRLFRTVEMTFSGRLSDWNASNARPTISFSQLYENEDQFLKEFQPRGREMRGQTNVDSTVYDPSCVVVHSIRVDEAKNTFMTPIGIHTNMLRQNVLENDLIALGGSIYSVPANSSVRDSEIIVKTENAGNQSNSTSTILTDSIGTTSPQAMYNGVLRMEASDRVPMPLALIPRGHLLEKRIRDHPNACYHKLWPDVYTENYDRPRYYTLPASDFEATVVDAAKGLYCNLEKRSIADSFIQLRPIQHSVGWFNVAVIRRCIMLHHPKLIDPATAADPCEENKRLINDADTIMQYMNQDGTLYIKLKIEYSIFPKDFDSYNPVCTHEIAAGREVVDFINNNKLNTFGNHQISYMVKQKHAEPDAKRSKQTHEPAQCFSGVANEYGGMVPMSE